MVPPREEICSRVINLVISNQSKGMMPVKFVHLFVDMSQINFQKPFKQLIIRTQQNICLKLDYQVLKHRLHNNPIYIYLILT
ncbi:hypothetical protein QF042_002306 [Pedobacter sp. W3I1]|nr:hypothetical protein [Pedobacter sp. W3I1]